jgi:hypothetical protein
MATVTKKELGEAGCGTPGCTHDHSVIYLTQGCHPGKGLEVRYDKQKEQLLVTCFACDADVTTIQL